MVSMQCDECAGWQRRQGRPRRESCSRLLCFPSAGCRCRCARSGRSPWVHGVCARVDGCPDDRLGVQVGRGPADAHCLVALCDVPRARVGRRKDGHRCRAARAAGARHAARDLATVCNQKLPHGPRRRRGRHSARRGRTRRAPKRSSSWPGLKEGRRRVSAPRAARRGRRRCRTACVTARADTHLAPVCSCPFG